MAVVQAQLVTIDSNLKKMKYQYVVGIIQIV